MYLKVLMSLNTFVILIWSRLDFCFWVRIEEMMITRYTCMSGFEMISVQYFPFNTKQILCTNIKMQMTSDEFSVQKICSNYFPHLFFIHILDSKWSKCVIKICWSVTHTHTEKSSSLNTNFVYDMILTLIKDVSLPRILYSHKLCLRNY